MSVARDVQTWGEMVKFSHSVFALPFALVATVMAGRNLPAGHASAGQFALIILCMVAARSFAMTFNRIADADLDARNPRTASRPIPTGRISRRSAWTFLIVFALLFALGCYGFLHYYANRWPLTLSLPTLATLAGYSYAKRFTPLAHFILGMAISFAPVAAWIAIHPASVGSGPPFLLMAAVMSWITGFDIIYACQDIDVDRREQLNSIPAALGIGPALLVSRGCHILCIAMLVGFGLVCHLGWIYWIGLGITAALLAAEQAVVRPNDLSRVNLAFFTLNGCVSLLFAAAAITDILLSGRTTL